MPGLFGLLFGTPPGSTGPQLSGIKCCQDTPILRADLQMNMPANQCLDLFHSIDNR